MRRGKKERKKEKPFAILFQPSLALWVSIILSAADCWDKVRGVLVFVQLEI